MELIKPEFIYTREDRPDIQASVLNVKIVYERSTIVSDLELRQAKFNLYKQTQCELRASIAHRVFSPLIDEMRRTCLGSELHLLEPVKQLRDLWIKG